jgi:hypothetical protein
LLDGVGAAVPPEVLSDAAVVARDVGETSGGKVSQQSEEDLSGTSTALHSE